MLKRELIIFLIVGSLTVVVDFLLYILQMHIFSINISVAKTLSFSGGTLFAYLANRSFTFKHKRPANNSLMRFCCVYILSLAVNVMVNAGSLQLLPAYSFSIAIAFIIATVCSATLNFLGMKFFVFTGKRL